MVKCSFSISRVCTERLVIWLKSLADFFHSHSYTCCARKAFSPFSTKKVFSSSSVSFRISLFSVLTIMLLNPHKFYPLTAAIFVDNDQRRTGYFFYDVGSGNQP